MSPQVLAYLLLALCPFFLSSNLVIGAYAVRTIEPFTLTFMRWGLASVMILPFALGAMRDHWPLFRKQWRMIFVLAFLAMGFCGSGVYLGLKYTSATNGTLIYAASPVLIIAMERVFRGRVVSLREIFGIILAIGGICFIVFQGSLETMLSVRFNSGDLIFVLASSSWAVYSVLSRQEVFRVVPTVGMFAIVAIAGALIQLPFMIWEIASYRSFPVELPQWFSLLGLAFISSVLAFTAYQYAIRVLGPAPSGFAMYLMPPVGVVLAVIFLGEQFQSFHMTGLVLVMAGVILATLPVSMLVRRLKRA